jgi:hypothetical protein
VTTDFAITSTLILDVRGEDHSNGDEEHDHHG